MMGLNVEVAVIVVWLGFLFFFSLIENAISQSSTLVLRMITERPDKSASTLLPMLLENKTQILIPLHFGTQLSAITVTILITHLCLRAWEIYGILYAFVAVILISILFRQLLPRLITQNQPEKKLGRLLRVFKPFYSVLRSLALPLASVLNLYKKLHEEVNDGRKSEGEEATDEEIQAYLEIGEDEGIIEEEDSELIQSVVEFGDTLVREVMTPRTKIIACDENSTIAELKEAMVQYRHSRIPIYRGDMDHIIGIAYIRQLMAEYAKGRETDSIAGLVNPALFVPGTKPVSKLLKELQERGDHTAIVIDEFGGVSGLVTIEDLVEEIVGEIWDEDEAKVNKIVEESAKSFVVHGSTELSRLEELTGRRFEDLNCSTAAGLIIAYLGRLPAPGEVFEMDGVRIKVLDADRKRVHWVRIQLQDISNKNAQTKDD
jgi:CBS domain containing-hemolysin-like protein